MNAVKTDNLKPGQVLAEEVRDVNGRLLLAGGNEIRSNHIRIFKIWGISEVNVAGTEGRADHDASEIDAELVEQIRNRLMTLCWHLDLEHPALKELFKLAIQFRSKNDQVEVESDPSVPEPESQPESTKRDFLNILRKEKIILPEIPSIVFELNEAIANPMSSAEHIGQIVNRSPSLTARMLKIVNSSFYGFPSKIDKVSHAVSLIGTREITSLALGISIVSIFKNIPKELVDMVSFLKHSLACGIFSRVFAAHHNLGQTEQLFVSGLLHDIGRLILYVHFPQESRIILSRSRNRSKSLYREEKNYLGCSHAEVGRQLMKQWKLPLLLENNVFYHHNPSVAQQVVPAAIVHLADIVVNLLGIGTSGEKFIPPFDQAAWAALDLPISSFEKLIGQATHQFRALESILHD